MKTIKFLLVILFSLAVAACGGGGSYGGGSSAPTTYTYSISGTVTLIGGALPGVTINLTGASTAATTTDASGNYSFTGLANGSYTVTPSKTGNTFSPVSLAVSVSGASMTGQNFTATASTATTYSISGKVSGAVLQNVTITLGGANSGSTTTDASGNYSFTGLANGSYTVTPSKTGNTFSPVSLAVSVSGASMTGQNFTATASTATTYSISGTFTFPGGVTAGVTMTLGGTNSGSTTTDASGNYSFTGLANGTYTVTPSGLGYVYNPPSTSVPVSGANVSNINFAIS
jgi:Carboxypeptidase regulatory-like domain